MISVALISVAAVIAAWLAVTVFNSVSRVRVVLAFGRTEITPILYPAQRGPLLIPFFDYDKELTSRKVAGLGIYLERAGR